MNSDWQLHVRREYVGGNPKFDFPIRPLGWGRLIGVFLVGFGCVFIGGPGKLTWSSIQKLVAHGFDIGNLIFALFPLVFVIAGCVPLGIGLLVLFGRCRVEWTDGTLRAAEILGPFRWTRRMPRKPVRKLEVTAATSKSGNAPPKQMENFAGLTAEFEDGSKKVVVLGYPKDWLLAVAQELRSYVAGGAFAAAKVEVTVADPTQDDPAAEDVFVQPAGSRVQVEESGSNLRLVMPPEGIWRGSKGLFFFGLLWCGFMVLFTSLTVFSAGKKPGDIPTVFWIFIPAFWAIGIGLLLGAINMGRRTARLEVDTSRLCIETRGLFGAKRREWTRADLSAVRADGSGMEVNDRPVIELQIHPRVGKKVGLLAGRNEDELRWIATCLRRALNLPAREITPSAR